MERDTKIVVPFENVQKRLIAIPIGLLKDLTKVPNGLVIV